MKKCDCGNEILRKKHWINKIETEKKRKMVSQQWSHNTRYKYREIYGQQD